MTGYFCIFKDAFFAEYIRGSLKELPMYSPSGKPAYLLNQQQDDAFAQIFLKMIRGADKAVIYDCIGSLDVRIPYCKLGMHANSFNETQISLILDPYNRQNGGSNRLNRLKSCHHSLINLCVPTDGA